jgi:DNA repair exonuclease SbcCD ATPase subunit/DNA repair exonuclease SbcCD nuclease subunit
MPIHHIFHVSDIHIRAGDSERSREEEYIQVFENLFQRLRAFPSLDESLIVVTGDIFHDKHRIGPPGIEMGVHLFQGLSSIAPTVVIRGNHDYRQDLPEEKDLISAIMKYKIPNLNYFNETGNYEIENIGFGIVAIQDALLPNSTSGTARTLPAFPPVRRFAPEITHRVALFHGSITKARLQNGTLYESSDGYPLDWFKEYDLVLLGDIHLQQVNRATKLSSSESVTEQSTQLATYMTQKGTWAYPGSLLQQDFGEPLLGHGFLHWDLENNYVTEHHIHNSHGTVKLQVDAQHALHLILQKELLPLETALSKPWFPQRIHVRVLGKGIKCNALLLDEIRRTLQDNGKVVLSISECYPPSVKSMGPRNEVVTTEQTEGSPYDIATLNNPETWTQFILENCKEPLVQENQSWTTWMSKPDTILIPPQGIPEALLSNIQDENDKVFKFVEGFLKGQEQQAKGSFQGTVTLKQVEWSWMFNYGPTNHYNFTECENKLTVLNAKNGCGKSNFFEIICYALFGEGFPSRDNTNYSTAIMNNQIPPNEYASTCIIFTINGKDYSIERIFGIKEGQGHTVAYKKGSPFLRSLPDYEIILQKTTKEIGKWLEGTIGDKNTFLASCMLTQDGDANFFAMEKSVQKKLIDNVFSLNSIQKLELLLKDAYRAHGSISKILNAYLVGKKDIKKSGTGSKEALQEQLEGLEGSLLELEGNLTSVHRAWSHLSPQTFQKDKAAYQAELALAPDDGEERVAYDMDYLKGIRAVLMSKVNPGATKALKPTGPVIVEEGLPKQIEKWSAELYATEFEGLEGPGDESLKTVAACRSVLDEKRIWQEGWNRMKGYPFAQEDAKGLLLAAEEEAKTFRGTRVAPWSFRDLPLFRGQLESLLETSDYKKAIADLETHEQEYPKVERAWKTCIEDHSRYSALVKEYETFPFNPACSACKAQPWKMALEDAKQQKVLLAEERKRLKPLMDAYDEQFSGLEEIQTLLKGQREGLALRLSLEERIENVESVNKWKILHENLERLRLACQFQEEATLWSTKEKGALLRLRTLLREMIETGSQWLKWYQWQTKERLQEVEASIQRVTLHQKRKTLLDIIGAFEPWTREQQLLEERQELQLRVGRVREELQRLEAADSESVRDALTVVDVRRELLGHLSVAFKGYREWLYTKKLGPLLQEAVSGLLKHVCESRPLFLEPEWLPAIDTFSWFLRDGASRTIIEKASGFQRFITGMAMRIAMSHLGICKIAYENLIIDEGFTACDTENLEKVPAFLKRLLSDGLYKGVMLATHLEDLKVCGDKQVSIERDVIRGVARLTFGTYLNVVPVKEPKKTKKVISVAA